MCCHSISLSESGRDGASVRGPEVLRRRSARRTTVSVPTSSAHSSTLRSSRMFPGPRVRDERLLGIGGNGQRRAPDLARQMLHQRRREACDVGLAVAQRRQPQDERVDAVVEVLAEAASRRPAGPVRGWWRPGTARRRAARRLHRGGGTAFPRPPSAASAGSARSVSPISSRNIVPRWAASRSPGLAADGAREGALLVAEELRLEQILGQAGAVQIDERLAGAAAFRVDPARRASPCRSRSRPGSGSAGRTSPPNTRHAPGRESQGCVR